MPLIEMTAALDTTPVNAQRKITRRLIPFLVLLYITAYLDRVNVSFAGLEMTRELRFSNEVFGFGAGIFFFGYCLLEIPGAMLAESWSALLASDSFSRSMKEISSNGTLLDSVMRRGPLACSIYSNNRCRLARAAIFVDGCNMNPAALSGRGLTWRTVSPISKLPAAISEAGTTSS